MNLPFSVLNTKKIKPLRIKEEKYENNEPKSISVDFNQQIEDIFTKGLVVLDRNDVVFIIDNMNHFYRNNIAVLFLTLNIMKDPSFIYTEDYNHYVSYIKREFIKDENNELFMKKLNHQIQCYGQKIQNVKMSILP